MSGIAQLINGSRYDFSSIELSINGLLYRSITEISYSERLEPQHLRGTHPVSLGRTRGEYSAEGSFAIYLEDADDFITKLSLVDPTKGWMEVAFVISVVYAEKGRPQKNHKLEGCRIVGTDISHSSGADVLVRTFDIDVIKISTNGAYAVRDNVGI